MFHPHTRRPKSLPLFIGVPFIRDPFVLPVNIKWNRFELRFAEITHGCVKFAQGGEISRVMAELAWAERSKAVDLRMNCKIEDDLPSQGRRDKR